MRWYASPFVADLHYETRLIFMEDAYQPRDQSSIWVAGDERAFRDMPSASFPGSCLYPLSEPFEYHHDVLDR